MIQPRLWFIAGIGAVAQNDTCIPDCSRVHGHIAGFLAETNTVNDSSRPRFSVAEPRLVVIGEDSEDRRAEANGTQYLCACSRHFLGVFFTHPIFVRKMNQQRYAGLYGRYHGRRTDSMDLNHDTCFPGFIQHRPEDVQFFLAWSWNGS